MIKYCSTGPVVVYIRLIIVSRRAQALTVPLREEIKLMTQLEMPFPLCVTNRKWPIAQLLWS